MNKLIRTGILSFCIPALFPASLLAEIWHLKPTVQIRYADIIGVGKIDGFSGEGAMNLSVDQYLYGSCSTAKISIADAPTDFDQDWHTHTNKTVLFCAVTNEWKSAPADAPFQEPYQWETRQYLTERGPSIPLSFRPNTPASMSWFMIEANQTESLTYLSNLVYSICISTNKLDYYESLRHALTSGTEEMSRFYNDAFFAILDFEATVDEPMLLHMANDELLPKRERGFALFNLQKRFGWSVTNGIPVPPGKNE